MTEILKGFLSREFIMHMLAFCLGSLLLYRNEASDIGQVLVMGSVASYGVLRTGQKVVEVQGAKASNLSGRV